MSKQITAEEAVANLNRNMPFSDEAEKAVLSCICQDPKLLRNCRGTIHPEAFYHEANRTIYEELVTMEEEGLVPDMWLLNTRLRDRGMLERVGGPAEIAATFTTIITPHLFPDYLDKVRQKWRARRAIHGRALAIIELYEHGKDGNEVGIETTINNCNAIVQSFDDSSTATAGTTATLSDCLAEHADHMEALEERKVSGADALIPTGFPSIDRTCGGLGSDEYWLITGPTKSGKSVLAGCIARHAARRGHKTKIYTNEVSRRTYAGRLLAAENPSFDGRIERRGFENRSQQDEYGKAMVSLQRSIGSTMLLDNAAGRYVEDIVADIRYEAERGLRLAVVDLIGKMRTRQRFQSREQEIAHMSLSLYEATKNFGVACIVLAQENEEGQVRESRSLAFDCEAWLKLTHVYPKKEKRSFGPAEEVQPMRDRRNIVVELARGFAAGDVIPCHFDGARFLIQELEHRP